MVAGRNFSAADLAPPSLSQPPEQRRGEPSPPRPLNPAEGSPARPGPSIPPCPGPLPSVSPLRGREGGRAAPRPGSPPSRSRAGQHSGKVSLLCSASASSPGGTAMDAAVPAPPGPAGMPLTSPSSCTGRWSTEPRRRRPAAAAAPGAAAAARRPGRSAWSPGPVRTRSRRRGAMCRHRGSPTWWGERGRAARLPHARLPHPRSARRRSALPLAPAGCGLPAEGRERLGRGPAPPPPSPSRRSSSGKAGTCCAGKTRRRIGNSGRPRLRPVPGSAAAPSPLAEIPGQGESSAPAPPCLGSPKLPCVGRGGDGQERRESY